MLGNDIKTALKRDRLLVSADGIIAGITICLAILMRIIAIGRDSYWYDEAISTLVAKWPIGDILNNSLQDPHPPLYYIVLHYWLKIVPDIDVMARLLSMVWGLLLIPAIYFLALELLGNRKQALFATFLAAISPFNILYSQELRMYSLLVFLATMTVIAYQKARNNGKALWWFLYGLFMLLSVYTHLFALFLLVGIALHALFIQRDSHSCSRVLLIDFTILVLFTPWLRLLWIELAGNHNMNLSSLRPLSHENSFNPIKPLTTLAFLLFGMSDNVYISGVAYFLTISLVVFLFFDLVFWKKKAPGNVNLPLIMGLVSIGIPITIYYIKPFFLPERTMAVASPFILLLLAWGIRQKRSPIPYLVCATTALMFISSLHFLAGDSIKPPYRMAIEYILDNRSGEDLVLHTSDGSYLPALSYVDIQNHALLAGDPDLRKPEKVYQKFGGEIWTRDSVIQSTGRLWLVVALEHSLEWQIDQMQFFSDRFTQLDYANIGDIEIYLYDLSAATP